MKYQKEAKYEGKNIDKYTVAEQGTTITYTGTTATGIITIPATVMIDGISYQVTSIADGAFKDNKDFTSVIIGENVTAIGNSAVSGCSNLESVSMEVNITAIGKEAFYGIKKPVLIRVKSSKLSSYTRLLSGKGQGSKAAVVRI